MCCVTSVVDIMRDIGRSSLVMLLAFYRCDTLWVNFADGVAGRVYFHGVAGCGPWAAGRSRLQPRAHTPQDTEVTLRPFTIRSMAWPSP